MMRARSCLLAAVLLVAAAHPARAEPSRKWIAAGILYGLAAVGTGLLAHGAYEVSDATSARTLGLYHANANRGETEAGIGAAALALGTITGTMVILIWSVSRSSGRRASLQPIADGHGIGVSF